jgi:hypothetical protein
MNSRGETRIPDPYVPEDQERTRLQKKKSGHNLVTEDASSADRGKLCFTPQDVR